ncbi:hypothetical protein [Pyrobaculum sp.]|jgi:hypothetical protein|uniref:hypothetical protein n=1 Tax=Pyrobaculum sp. TaxID=2004705 RepID=UPI003D10C491
MNCNKRAYAYLGELACEMAETWRRCVERRLVEKIPELCLAAYAAVIDARGSVVRANFEDFIDADFREKLGRARRRLFPHFHGVVEYEEFIKTAALRYLLLKNALQKTQSRLAAVML